MAVWDPWKVSPLLCTSALVQHTTFNRHVLISTICQALGTQESAESNVFFFFPPLGAYNLVEKTGDKTSL